MFRTNGLYLPTHRPFPASPAKADAQVADKSRVPATEPFLFTRLFLVTGILLAAIALASLVSA